VEKLLARTSRPKLLKGLPSYQWEHSRIHWHESRISRKTRARSTPYNEILGFKSPESTEHELRWTNLLKPSEIRWLNGHQLQGQIVFPAAGYIAMAIEASKSLAGEKEVKYFEVHDLVIKKAITFDDDSNFAVETLVTLTGIISANGVTNSQKADFCCYSCVNGKDSDLELVASGSVKVIYGKAQSSTLPSTPSQSFNMNPVDGDRFYSALQDLGYGYTGPFKGLSGLKRKLDYSTALISSYVYGHPSEFMIVHPTTLDVAFQAAFLAQSSPGDQRLWALHVPVSIQCVRVNAHLSGSLPLSGTTLPVDATLAETSSISILGDINIYSEDHQHTIIQVEGLTMVPFSAATAADDRCLFSHTKWIPAAPTSNAIAGEDRASSEELELATLSERLGYYYLRKWKAEISEDEWTHGKWHHQRLRDYVNHLLTVIEKGEHPHVRKEWAEDSISYLQELVSKYASDPSSI
jgi:hybrid polyketide synthase/nonribosomal peptide synthetase ACE1